MNAFAAPNVYPGPWAVECLRNAQGRAWYAVSRFVSRNRLEYVSDAAGETILYRTKPAAVTALERAPK